jgi:chromosome segregation ATPase
MDIITVLISIGGPVLSAFGASFLLGKKVGKRSEALEVSLASLRSSDVELKAAMTEERQRSQRIEAALDGLRNQDGSLEAAIGNMSESMSQTVHKVEDLNDRVHNQEVRLGKLEQALTALPSMGADIAAMRDSMGALRAEAAHLRGLLEAAKPRTRAR